MLQPVYLYAICRFALNIYFAEIVLKKLGEFVRMHFGLKITIIHFPLKIVPPLQSDQIWRFIGLLATFQSLWQQLICPNLPHF